MSTPETTNENKPAYVGLWTKNDKNGNPFLSGNTEDVVYFIFRDKKDSSKKRLFTLDKTTEGAELEKIGLFENCETEDGNSYMRLDNMCVFENTRRTEDKHPHFNLVIYDNDA